ncbi:MAG: lipopolysaccharide heptosyltransferase II [Verrucomicrobia bacterium]|nr:lipopolysaccharide heptosyltransferase II [Verrucomicrobiota bacterium]
MARGSIRTANPWRPRRAVVSHSTNNDVSPPGTNPADHPRRLLVRGVNWLGDAVMTTPALLRLREALPDSRITLLTHEKLADLWTHHPALDATLTYGAKDSVLSVAKKLRDGAFDAALLFPNSVRAALEVSLARIPRRIGYAGGGRSFLLTQPVPRRPDVPMMKKRTAAEIQSLVTGGRGASGLAASGGHIEQAHHIHHYLHLAGTLGARTEPLAPKLEVLPGETSSAVARFCCDSTSDLDAPLFALVPGAEYGPAKRWPVDHFAEAAVEIHRRTNCRWVLLGGKADAAICAHIADKALRVAGTPSRMQSPGTVFTNLAGRTSLRELCALLRACRVVLANDTGPMHLAAAVGTPVVALFGSTSPDLTAPGLPGDPRHQLLRARAACSPCFLRECPIDFRCMTGIPVARVVEAVMSAIR